MVSTERVLKLVTLFLATCNSYRDGLKSDIGLNTVQMIENHGYTCETHYITTQDGYILTFHRIPPSTKLKNKLTVLIIHGLFSSSAEYVNYGNKSLAFILSDEGYDVWLSNNRGNDWSRRHTILQVQKNPKKIFDFSWHEIGYYDVPSAIDYILKFKKEDSLMYIGTSQGATVFMVMASTRPEYNRKIKIAHLMGPATSMAHSPSLVLSFLCEYLHLFGKRSMQNKIYEVPYTRLIRKLGSHICTNKYWDFLCDIVIRGIPLVELHEMDKDLLRVILTNFPSSAAMKQIFHYAQTCRSGRFAQYDYGPRKNIKKYGSKQPPLYNLAKITAPVAFYYAPNDGLLSLEVQKMTLSQLGNVVFNYSVPRPSFRHGDFVFDRDVDSLIFDKLLNISTLYVK